MSVVAPSICRFCAAHCGILVETEGGRIVAVTGDRSNPLYRGYVCPKGRALAEQHNHPGRLLHSLKLGPDGRHAPVPHAQAVDEIAAKLRSLLDQYGPRSIAVYVGTYSFMVPAAAPMTMAWMNAIGSPMRFMPATIDKPGKAMAMALHGRWAAGPQPFRGADGWMLVGANPVVSKSIGAPPHNPAGALHDAVKGGMQLIVIDPRRTEAARLATVHLQCRPGEDPTVMAGLMRAILRDELHDQAFVREHASGLDALRQAVEAFSPEYVERRADVPRELLLRAARIFATSRQGFAVVGTGPNMAPRGTLTEYLTLCLNTLCGRWLRAGESLPNPGVLTPAARPTAEPIAPTRAWGFGERLRVRGLTNTAAGLPTAALADEILLDGPGQVRALICIGGNPVAAWPDQQRTQSAMKRLELLVTIDPEMSATAKLAHYVIAPRLSFEQPGLTLPVESLSAYAYTMGYEEPYAQYAPQLVDPPAGSDVIEEWQFFYGLAARMGLTLSLESAFPWIASGERAAPVVLDMEHAPTTDALLELLTQGSRIPLAEVRAHPHGHVFDDLTVTVGPKDPACTARLELADPVMLAELDEVARESGTTAPGFAFRLISRRLPDVYNSYGRSIPRLVRKHRHNPAFLHPDDLRELGVAPGDIVEIHSGHDSILGVAEADDGLRRGVVSMTHAFGDLHGPNDETEARQAGSNTGRLIPVDRDFDPYTGIPRMSAVPVEVRRFAGSASR